MESPESPTGTPGRQSRSRSLRTSSMHRDDSAISELLSHEEYPKWADCVVEASNIRRTFDTLTALVATDTDAEVKELVAQVSPAGTGWMVYTSLEQNGFVELLPLVGQWHSSCRPQSVQRITPSHACVPANVCCAPSCCCFG